MRSNGLRCLLVSDEDSRKDLICYVATVVGHLKLIIFLILYLPNTVSHLIYLLSDYMTSIHSTSSLDEF